MYYKNLNAKRRAQKNGKEEPHGVEDVDPLYIIKIQDTRLDNSMV